MRGLFAALFCVMGPQQRWQRHVQPACRRRGAGRLQHPGHFPRWAPPRPCSSGYWPCAASEAPG